MEVCGKRTETATDTSRDLKKKEERMELRITNPQESWLTEQILWNNEELKAAIAEKVKDYKTIAYTEDSLKDMKADRADLNKLKKAFEDERKRVKKICMEPYTKFEQQVKEITALIDEPIELIDSQIKELDERRKEYSPEMRDEAFRRGLEEYKREIEFNVGLAYGDLSDAQEVDKTATEVLASKTRKYNRVTAIQGKLEECLNGFVTALAFYNGSYMSGVEFTCEFNDSILADEESERQQDRQDVSMGVMSLLEYRMKWYNEDEETAKAKLPEQNQVME